MSRRRKKRLHPILAEINKHQRAIGTLKRAAEMIGLDLAPILPQPTRIGPKKAAAYHAAMQAPLDPPPVTDVMQVEEPETDDKLEIPKFLKREKPSDKPNQTEFARLINKPFREVAKRRSKKKSADKPTKLRELDALIQS